MRAFALFLCLLLDLGAGLSLALAAPVDCRFALAHQLYVQHFQERLKQNREWRQLERQFIRRDALQLWQEKGLDFQQIEFLGQGQGGGGEVFLINRLSESPFVVKRYRRQERLEYDLQALHLLRGLRQDQNELIFRIPEAEALSQQLMRLSFIKGLPLNELLATPERYRIGRRTHHNIKQNYEQAVEQLPTILRARGFWLEHIPDYQRLPFTARSPEGQGYHFFVKPENVLVDATDGSLWLIDPF